MALLRICHYFKVGLITATRITAKKCATNEKNLLPREKASLILINVKRRCLVKFKEGDNFLDLSYVWGRVSNLQSLKSNFGQLQEDGAFDTFED